MEARGKRGEVMREEGGRGPRRSTSETRERRERARHTRVRRARACPNKMDTHERASESRRLNKASGERRGGAGG